MFGKFQSHALILVSTALLLVVSGCNSAVVRSQANPKSPKVSIDGVVYALPRGFVEVSLANDGKSPTTFSANAKIVADPAQRYVLDYVASSAATDIVDLSVDANGLLSNSTTTADDKSVEIVDKIAALTGEFRQLQSSAVSADPNKAFKFDFFLDPFSLGSIATLNKGLEASPSSSRYRVKLEFLAGAPSPAASGQLQASDKDCSQGICVRIPVPVFLSLLDAKSGETLFKKMVVLPDPSVLVELQVTRTPCVVKKNTVVLQDGMIKSNKIEKQSEALACLGIPARIVKSLLGGSTIPKKP